MKLKHALAIAMPVVAFAAAFTSTRANADIYPDRACFLACMQEYQACMTYTPDKADLCWQRRIECLRDCGTFL